MAACLVVCQVRKPPVKALLLLEGCHYSASGSGGGSFVVVDEAAEAVESLDWACAELRWRVRGSEPEPAVGTLAVVVLDVLADDVREVALVADQDPVEALAADRADEPLGIGVRDRRSDWGEDRADPFAREDGVERGARPAVRRSTATSWRRITISASYAASRRRRTRIRSTAQKAR